MVIVAQHEAHRGKEVALAGAIATNDNVAFGREGFDLCLVLVAESHRVSIANARRGGSPTS